MCTVTADTEGTAVITAATADDGKTAQCQIIVCHTIDNTDFIKAVGGQCCWNLTGSGTVLLTPENLERIQAVTELYISGEGDRTLCDLPASNDLPV